MSLITDSRTDLVSAITGLGAKVYTYVPAVPVPPALVVIPAETWIVPGSIGARSAVLIAWKITAIIAPRKNDAATLDVENIVYAVLGALPAGYAMTRVGAPQIVDLGGQGSAYTVEISVQAQIRE